LDQMDLIEINEAFAAMPLVYTKLLAKGDEWKEGAVKSFMKKMAFIQKKKKREILSWLGLRKGSAQTS
jgi:hypothetical protein